MKDRTIHLKWSQYLLPNNWEPYFLYDVNILREKSHLTPLCLKLYLHGTFADVTWTKLTIIYGLFFRNLWKQSEPNIYFCITFAAAITCFPENFNSHMNNTLEATKAEFERICWMHTLLLVLFFSTFRITYNHSSILANNYPRKIYIILMLVCMDCATVEYLKTCPIQFVKVTSTSLTFHEI